MTKLLGLLVAGAMFASCPGGPNPTPPPTKGYDCGAQPTLSGLVPVANALAGRYIVVLKHKPTIHPLVQTQEVGVSEVKTLERGFAAKIAQQAIAKLLSDPNVAYIQMDGIKSVSPFPAEATLAWGLDRIDQRDLPLDGDFAPGATAEGVNVAIVDTGVTNVQSEFEGRLQADCFSAHGACTDGHGHGTHVAGTLGSKSWGVAKKATLWASRVLDANGSGSDSDVIRGIEWVVARKASVGGDWVINMSLGGGDSPALNQATCDAIAAGVVVVVAAGNESQDADKSSPARVKQAVTVGASDKQDAMAYFSNFGSLLDLFGPGVNVVSLTPEGGQVAFSGTSMAAPHVAGGAALYLARYPGSSPAIVESGLSTSASVDKLSGIGAGSPNLLLFAKEN